MLTVSVDRVLHGMMQYIEDQFQHQMTPRVKTTHRHHRALLLLGSAAIIFFFVEGVSRWPGIYIQLQRQYPLQFAVSHDIPKNGFNLALPDGKQCFVGKYQIEVQDFQVLLHYIQISCS